MLEIGSLLVFSEDPKRLSDFYGKVFQKDPDGNYFQLMTPWEG